MNNKRVTEIGSSKNKLDKKTLQPTIDDLICKETSFLKLTKDDFEFIEVEVTPSSITEPEVTSMEVNNSKNYFYELTPKLDWINDVNDFEKLGYRIKLKGANGNDFVDEVRGLFDGFMEDNIICVEGKNFPLTFMNNGKNDYKEGKFVEKNCFYIELIVSNNAIDFELELFKIDTIPLLPSFDDLAYYLAIGKDGKLYKFLENR